jgi:hypothetical protein
MVMGQAEFKTVEGYLFSHTLPHMAAGLSLDGDEGEARGKYRDTFFKKLRKSLDAYKRMTRETHKVIKDMTRGSYWSTAMGMVIRLFLEEGPNG